MTAKEFVIKMMDNEGTVFGDPYGRRWKYSNFKFYFKDIETTDTFKEGISCLHLSETNIRIIPSKDKKQPCNVN